MFLELYFRDHIQWSAKDMEKARQKAEDNSTEIIPAEEQGKIMSNYV